MTKQGIFIAIEGIDGAGKTTQVQRLTEALKAIGEPVVSSKEPTDGPWGRKIRQSASNGRLSLQDELHALTEDRREHVEKVIRPALDRGDIVILDRYFYSTIAYQGASGADIDQIVRDMAFAPVPDITFVFDIHPAVALERISGSRGDTPNEFERDKYLGDVRAIFQTLLNRPEVRQIDASQSVDGIYRQIVEALVNGPLKSKRYECDVFYCALRITGECNWFNVQAGLKAKSQQS